MTFAAAGPQFLRCKGASAMLRTPQNHLRFCCAHQALSTTSDAFTPFAVPVASMYWGD